MPHTEVPALHDFDGFVTTSNYSQAGSGGRSPNQEVGGAASSEGPPGVEVVGVQGAFEGVPPWAVAASRAVVRQVGGVEAWAVGAQPVGV